MSRETFSGANEAMVCMQWAMESVAINSLLTSFKRGESPALPDRGTMESSRAALVERVTQSALQGASDHRRMIKSNLRRWNSSAISADKSGGRVGPGTDSSSASAARVALPPRFRHFSWTVPRTQ